MKWQEPPPSQRGSGRRLTYLSEAAELRAHPGQWALLGAFAPAQVTNIKQGYLKAFRPAGEFDAIGRKRDDGKYDIYIRYIGKV